MSNSFVDTPVKRVRAFKLPPPPRIVQRSAVPREPEPRKPERKPAKRKKTQTATFRTTPDVLSRLRAIALHLDLPLACVLEKLILDFPLPPA
jgi:hypothetical protein